MKPKKLKAHHVVLIIICVLVCTLIASGFILYNKYSYVKDALTMSADEIALNSSENEAMISNLLHRTTDTDIHDLNEEQKESLFDGKLSDSDARSIILGSYTEKSFGDAGSETVYNRKDELIADIYILRSKFEGVVNSLIDEAFGAYRSLSKEDRRSLNVKLDLLNVYMGKATAAEAECDAQFESILSELRAELENSDSDVGLISEIRSAYEEQKRIKKAELVNKYYPK